MTTAIKRRRGTTVQHSTFTGLEGEITVDTTKDTLVVHDGATAGGFPLATEAAVNSKVSLTGDETVAGTKTLSSNPILSAGTANGVAYLNGSKVLTSGSALTFDGKIFSLANTASSASNNLQLTGLNDFGNAYVLTGSSSAASGFYVGTQTNIPFIFYQNNAEQMRLTSTGLGIGTSSPSQKLDVSGNIRTTGSVYGTSFINLTNGISYFTDASTGNGIYVGGSTATPANTVLVFTNAAEAARFDASGNFIHQVNGTAPTLATNSTMSFELTSNTSLKIVVRGTDGVTRSVSLTLA